MKTPAMLTKSNYQDIVAAQRRLNALMPAIEKLERCGQDCQEFRALATYLSERYGELLREHFPDEPRGA